MESSLFKTRQMLFALDSIIESRRKAAYKWKHNISAVPLKVMLQKYCCGESFNAQNFLKLWNQSDICKKIETDKIIEMIYEQCRVMGEDTAELLLKELFEQIFYKEWLMFKRDLECIKHYLHFYRDSEDETLYKYIGICDIQCSLFQQNVMNNLLGYFLSAKIESIVQKK